MTDKPKKVPAGLWVFFFSVSGGLVIGALYGLFTSLGSEGSLSVIHEVGRYAAGFGVAGIVCGVLGGLIVTMLTKNRPSG